MTTEAPQQIDLSQDLAEQGIQLSPEQQESFQAYLDGLKQEEKEGVIYLTKQELESLSKILEARKWPTDDNIALHNIWEQKLSFSNNTFNATWEQELDFGNSAFHNAWEQKLSFGNIQDRELTNFLQEQRDEGISLEDMFWGFQNAPETLKESFVSLEEHAETFLFWSEGIFRNLDISDTAKDYMSMAMIMSFASYGMDITGQELQAGKVDVSQIQTKFIEISQEMEAKFWAIQVVIDKTESSDTGDTPDVSIVHMREKWEGNRICMDLEVGKAFFDGILKDEINAGNVEKIIEAENVEDGESIDTNLESVIWTFEASSHTLKDIIQKLTPEQKEGLAGALQNPGSIPDESWDSSPENGAKLTGLAKILHDFFKALTEGFKWFADAFGIKETDGNDTETEDNPSPDAETETEAENNNSLSSQLQNLHVADMDITSLQENPESLQKIEQMLEGLDPNTTAKEEFTRLFGTQNNYSRISSIFQENNSPFLEGMSDSEKFMTILQTYHTYRNDPEVAGKMENRPTWKAWSQKNDWSHI